MRRTILSARPSRAVYHALGNQQPRRTFAAPPIKDNTPPTPIEPSQEQAHPVGPFYEAILQTPNPLAKEKPEEPPVTSQRSSKPAPKSAAPEPEKPQSKAEPAKPAVSEEKKAAATAKAAPQAQEEAAEDKKAPPKRTRKAPSSTKAKSVPPPPTPSSSSFPTPSTPSSSTSPSQTPSPTPPPGPTILPQSPSQSERTPETTQEEKQTSESDPTSNTTPQARARIVFGASLAGPRERAERLARLRTETRVVAGVRVPPRPEEPDNCCMSGCVNCVWDRYRDEMEEWAGMSAEAERRLAAQLAGRAVGVTEESMEGVAGVGQQEGGGMDLGIHDVDLDRGPMEEGVSMDDDGGGSAANWETPRIPSNKNAAKPATKDFWDDDLYKNVPVGIREFMKHEKRLKEKHVREGTVGG
ncbi:oxidoreductase-like protein [Chaetomium sp. MPI-SDFR-AT-0129]|nr:oxidoreductase-like protein [Chaetomium sp. MPI-SDFR-AT-0129]